MPLKNLLSQWGEYPAHWEVVWGDFFQLEVEKPEEALRRALWIKALIKGVTPETVSKKSSNIDVRMAIGIGEKTFAAKRISESNGSAFVKAGEKFAMLKKERVSLAVKSPWTNFDEEVNLYLRLAGLFMDKWSVSSAELIQTILHEPAITQEEIGHRLRIKQNSVSGRWSRSNADEILKIERVFRIKLKELVHGHSV